MTSTSTSNDCSYTCSAQASVTLRPNPDISGKGVIIGFVSTAYIAVLALVAYYFLAHDPYTDPFGKRTDGSLRTIQFRPNPVDNLVLRRLATRRNPRTTEALSKVIFTMADIQTLTGFAILISAYASLHCGLQAYHWQIIVYLVWFSSLTHLAALTTVRQQLNYWRGMRFWRLFAMFFLAVMLIIALVPTANFDFFYGDESEVQPSDYVTCLFTRIPNQDSYSRVSYYSMIVSTMVISTSFLTRVIRLYPHLSERSKQLKRFCSEKTVQKLRSLHEWSSGLLEHTDTGVKRHHRVFASLVRSGIYYPACAWYLLSRSSFDICTSLLWEIVWLIYAITWGTIHLFLSWNSASDGSSNTWSFGQIIPLVLLAAPFMSALEFFFPAAGNQASEILDSNTASTGNDITNLPSYDSETLSDFVLDHDFYLEFWFKCLISLILLLTLEVVIWVSIDIGYGVNLVEEILRGTFSWLVLTAPLSLYCFTLFSVIAPRLQTGKLVNSVITHWVTHILIVMCFVALTVCAFTFSPFTYSLIGGALGIEVGPPETTLFALLGAYILGTFIVAVSYFFR